MQSQNEGGIVGGILLNRTKGAAMDRGISRRATNKLNDRRIKAFIAKGIAGKKLSDGAGMYLMLTPARTAVWRIKYRFDGAERVYAVGIYPGIGLSDARAERERVKGLLSEGRDPVQARDVSKAEAVAASGNTFADVTRDWLAKRGQKWSAIHRDKSGRALERDVLPSLGKLPVSEIRPAMVSRVIEAIVAREAHDTARKVLQHVNGIFRLAQARDLCRDNPADPVREILPAKAAVTRRPAVLEWAGLGDILRCAETARLSPAVRMAHRLCAYSMMRISNVVNAEWSEFALDTETPVWVIPRKKMKAQDRQHDHKVILGPTIAAELREWRNLTGGKGHVFPSPAGGKRGAHLTRESIEKAYRVTLGLDGKHSPHGWRAAFATLARDNDFDRDAVEIALDHIHDTNTVRAYDRGSRLAQRVKLAGWWDEQLAQAQRGADVLPLTRKGLLK
ncbi:MAG: integrase arm-type DNA-binding domain-containing protein [Betaproteobacteria bacterium]|nr:integrase arm-type DNA-binding domain-containing protein [Betaproteobacteria bacterium]